MNTSMRELNLEEMEKVNGGILALLCVLGLVGGTVAVACAIGQALKDDTKKTSTPDCHPFV